MVHSEQGSLRSAKFSCDAVNKNADFGITIAFVIIGLWAISLILLFSIDISKFHFVWGLAILLQTFLYTGLFITAHDAMHGVVFFNNLKVNHLIGSIAVLLYGLFSYKDLMRKHWLHHRYPASDRDPDFHNNRTQKFLSWYFHFMKNYFSWAQLVGLIFIFQGFHYLLHIPKINLVLFWVIPSILSSIQLFYFGTFLTHREPKGGYTNSHRSCNTPFPVFLSFMTCYHFGYHEEHHEYPCLPWWQLPEMYRKNLNSTPATKISS